MDKKFELILQNFFSLYPLEKFKKGQVIIKPGEKINYVGFIKSGYVRAYMINESGQEVTMSFFKPILYFSTIFGLTDAPNKFYFESITPVEMWTAPKEEFIEYCRKNPVVSHDFMSELSRLFLNMVETMGKLLYSDSLNKVAIIILSIIDSKPDFALTHKMIASLTGLTRETVTLQMLKLEKLKLIDNKNRKVIILNKEGMQKFIGK